MGISTVRHHPTCLPSVYLMSLHVTKSSRPSPSVFAYCKRSNTGGRKGLGMRLTFWCNWLIEFTKLSKLLKLSKLNGITWLTGHPGLTRFTSTHWTHQIRYPTCLPSVYLMSLHVTKSSRPSPSVFAYCKRSNTGGRKGLGMRLTFWCNWLIEFTKLSKLLKLSKLNGITWLTGHPGLTRFTSTHWTHQIRWTHPDSLDQSLSSSIFNVPSNTLTLYNCLPDDSLCHFLLHWHPGSDLHAFRNTLHSENAFPDPIPSFLVAEQSTTEGASSRGISCQFLVCLHSQRLREDGDGLCGALLCFLGWCRCVATPILFVYSVSVLAFAREPEFCLSVTGAVFPCALLSFTVCCAVLFVFWCTISLWNKRWNQWTEEDRENDKDTNTLLVDDNQRVHDFQERAARQTFPVTGNFNQSNESNVRARRIACACWPALVGI